MIYEGIFENREGRNIVVKIDTGGDSETVGTTSPLGLTVNNPNLNTTVHSKKFVVIKGSIFNIISTGAIADRLVTIRMYKGFTYRFLAPSSTMMKLYPYDLAVTDLSNKLINVQMAIEDMQFNFTATEDGYIYLNLNQNNYLRLTRTGKKLEELIFSDNPVSIVLNSNGLLEPLKLTSATVRIMTDTIKDNLFSGNSLAVSCEIADNLRLKILFRGYLTPSIYTQNFTAPYEELELECVSPISTLEYKKWVPEEENILSWYQIIKKCLLASGVYDRFYIHNNFSVNGGDAYLKELFIDQNSFKDGDDWLSCKDILEQFCITFGLTIVEYEGFIYFVDYAKLYEDNEFTRYDLSTDQELDAEVGTIIYLGDSTTSGDLYFTNDQLYISFDELYGNIKVVSETLDFEELHKILNLDPDNLICLHPNVPYIEYSSYDPAYYNDLSGDWRDRHNDIYRFYILKDADLFYYTSRFDTLLKIFGLGQVAQKITETTIPNMDSNDPAVVKNALETFLRNNACCLVVKHFHYKLYDYKEHTSKIDWETCLFFSYGLKNNHFVSNDNFNSEISTLLMNHYKTFYERPFFATSKRYSYLKDTYLDLNAKCYFMNYPFFTECGVYNAEDTVKKYTWDQIRPTFTCDWGSTALNLTIYTTLLGVGLLENELEYIIDWKRFPYTYLTFTDASWKNWDSTNMYYKAALDFLYKWHDPYNNVDYTNNVLDTNGHIVYLDKSYDAIVCLSAPVPYSGLNNAVANFAMVKDIDLSVKKKYPIEVVLSGEVPKDADIREEISTGYFDNDEFELSIKFSSLAAVGDINLGSILYNGGTGLLYLGNISYNGLSVSLEKMICDRYYNHYKDPKLIFRCTVNDSRDVAPYNIITSKYLNKDFAVDEIDYDVLHNQRTITLIQQ